MCLGVFPLVSPGENPYPTRKSPPTEKSQLFYNTKRKWSTEKWDFYSTRLILKIYFVWGKILIPLSTFKIQILPVGGIFFRNLWTIHPAKFFFLSSRILKICATKEKKTYTTRFLKKSMISLKAYPHRFIYKICHGKFF